TVALVQQRVVFVERGDKREVLCAMLKDPALARVLVFTRTKHLANRVAEQLDRSGFHADAIHGNKPQNARQRALEAVSARGHRVPACPRPAAPRRRAASSPSPAPSLTLPRKRGREGWGQVRESVRSEDLVAQRRVAAP